MRYSTASSPASTAAVTCAEVLELSAIGALWILEPRSEDHAPIRVAITDSDSAFWVCPFGATTEFVAFVGFRFYPGPDRTDRRSMSQ